MSNFSYASLDTPDFKRSHNEPATMVSFNNFSPIQSPMMNPRTNPSKPLELIKKPELSNPLMVFVGGITSRTSKNKIREILQQFGPIEEIIPSNLINGGKSGYCFAVFKTMRALKKALNC